MIRGGGGVGISREMIQIQARKSELQAQSWSHGTKSQSCSRADPQNPSRIAQKRAPNVIGHFCKGVLIFSDKKKTQNLDGPAIRNANRSDSRESIRVNRFTGKPYVHNVRAIRANRLKPTICKFLRPETRFAKKGFSSGLESADSRESANQFARIGPSKEKIPCGGLPVLRIHWHLSWEPLQPSHLKRFSEENPAQDCSTWSCAPLCSSPLPCSCAAKKPA